MKWQIVLEYLIRKYPLSLGLRKLTHKSQSHLRVRSEEGGEIFIEIAGKLLPETLAKVLEKIPFYSVCASPVEYLVQHGCTCQTAEQVAKVVRAGPLRGNHDDLVKFSVRDDLAREPGQPEDCGTE